MLAASIPQAFDNPYEEPPRSNEERRERRRRFIREFGAARARQYRHVYFVEGGGLIKIGSAFDIALRLQQLQDGSPVPLRLVGWVKAGGEQLERALHRNLRSKRDHGEWFRITWAEVKAQWKEITK